MEPTGAEAHLFPYQQLISAALIHADGTETLTLTFASHEIACSGRNLRELFHAVQDFAVKWMRPMPERYHATFAGNCGLIATIRITPAA